MVNQPELVLLTGAAGRIGTCLRELLPAYGYRLRCFDRLPVPGEPQAVTAGLQDAGALAAAMEGVDAVVHLAGIAGEAPFADILAANIDGTYRLFDAARAAGVRRIVYASSNHAVGFTERPAGGAVVPVDTPQRPDTFYGLSKCFGENLASLYADRHGIDTVSLRIGSFAERPRGIRALGTWLSPGDCARLVHAALAGPVAGHAVVYGISANSRAWWDLSSARALGYQPQDDAEVYAQELLAELGELPADDPEYRYLGGRFTR
ncbi:NAD-dependent dehydratase [Kitasatospora aureofaciens]|uniref:NAD-dependent dehydratase n=1 Tax=Kitasatospora aureofaciens TaxID=1894 RepID=A0A1E7N2V6_KITAU|nr:NAD(P)-dependent oxidoreductase [Kitasatospora aureofaciens]OEV35012.1 NAD-dependent dehydratase [Kitasatospora aureofaciens]GGU69300.1 NAD-dependent dehydratase [Kitasatospora aureofaciens]